MPFTLPRFFSGRVQKNPLDVGSELWFTFSGSKLLVDPATFHPVCIPSESLSHSLYLGTYKDFHIQAGEIVPGADIPSDSMWTDMRMLYGKIEEPFYAIAGAAMQWLAWDRMHRFCGQCGKETTSRITERAKECRACKLYSFPKISPVVMALVKKGEEILLAKGTASPTGFYSALAGFVEPGETLEQCLEREVFEEVGLRVHNIRYFGSQSWPFSGALMVAFTCEWKSGEITIDPKEILDAGWFTREHLPHLPPEFSISRILIDSVFPFFP